LSNSKHFSNALIRRACHDIKGNIANAAGFVQLLPAALNSSAADTCETQADYLSIIAQEHAKALIDLNTLLRYAMYLESPTEATEMIDADEFKALIIQAHQQCQKKTQSALEGISDLNVHGVLASKKVLSFALTELFYHLFRAKIKDNASQSEIKPEKGVWTIKLSQKVSSESISLLFLIKGNLEEVGHSLSLMLVNELLEQCGIQISSNFEKIDSEDGSDINSLLISMTLPNNSE
jgi:hypothetical protein